MVFKKLFMTGIIACCLSAVLLNSANSKKSSRVFSENHDYYKNFLSEGIEYQPTTKNIFNADITYLFADLKYRDGALKICEFGQGKNAATAMTDILIKGNLENVVTPYWPMFWNYLAQFNVPIWYVGPEIKKQRTSPGVLSLYESIAWDVFQDIGGYCVKDLAQLEVDQRFQTQKNTRKIFCADTINTYKAIIVYRYRDDRFLSHQQALENFKQAHPDCLVIDTVSWEYAASKEKLAWLIQEAGLSQYKPKWGIYSKSYTPDLAQKITNDLGCDMFVIKPVNSGRSNGIIFVEKKDLDTVLKKILCKKNSQKNSQKNSKEASLSTLNYRPYATQLFEYWELDPNDVFMVEEYQSSKNITIKNNTYDPTMRIVFTLCYTNGKIYAHILGGYWKIPALALDQSGDVTAKHKTVSVKTPGFTGLCVSRVDMCNMKKLAYDFLPKIYEAMLEKNLQKHMCV